MLPTRTLAGVLVMIGRKRKLYVPKPQVPGKKRWQEEIDREDSDVAEVTAEDIEQWRQHEEHNHEDSREDNLQFSVKTIDENEEVVPPQAKKKQFAWMDSDEDNGDDIEDGEEKDGESETADSKERHQPLESLQRPENNTVVENFVLVPSPPPPPLPVSVHVPCSLERGDGGESQVQTGQTLQNETMRIGMMIGATEETHRAQPPDPARLDFSVRRDQPPSLLMPSFCARQTVAVQNMPMVSHMGPARAMMNADPIPQQERFVGRIKRYVDMPSRGGYGFIDCGETRMRFARDVYIHKNQMLGFHVGDQVSFTIVRNSKGEPQARNVMTTEDAVLLRMGVPVCAAGATPVNDTGPINMGMSTDAKSMLMDAPSAVPMGGCNGLMNEDQAKKFQVSLREMGR